MPEQFKGMADRISDLESDFREIRDALAQTNRRLGELARGTSALVEATRRTAGLSSCGMDLCDTVDDLISPLLPSAELGVHPKDRNIVSAS